MADSTTSSLFGHSQCLVASWWRTVSFAIKDAVIDRVSVFFAIDQAATIHFNLWQTVQFIQHLLKACVGWWAGWHSLRLTAKST